MNHALEKHSSGRSGGGFHWLDFHWSVQPPSESQDHLVSVCAGHCKIPSWWFIIRCIWWSTPVKPPWCAVDSEVIFTYRWPCKTQTWQTWWTWGEMDQRFQWPGMWTHRFQTSRIFIPFFLLSIWSLCSCEQLQRESWALTFIKYLLYSTAF